MAGSAVAKFRRRGKNPEDMTPTPEGVAAAQELQDLFEQQQWLSTQHEMWVQQQVAKWAAMRENNRQQLKIIIDWPEDRQYIVDPLPAKISEAFADLLFGEDSVFTAAQTAQQRAEEALKRAKQKAQEAAQLAEAQRAAAAQPPPPPPRPGEPAAPGAQPATRQPSATAPTPAPTSPQPPQPQAGGVTDQDQGRPAAEADTGEDMRPTPVSVPGEKKDEGDQELLDNLVEANNMPSELRVAEEICSSEGEVWWKIYTDEGLSEYPIVEWYSRSHVRPLFRGRKLIAAAFVSEIFREELGQQWEVFRYVEIQAEGIVRNLLYKGTTTSLGNQISLDKRPETERLQDEWRHSFGMLCGRIPNKLGRDRRYGVSDYLGIEDLLFSLNEATTIGHENMRLTAKKRVAVPREALQDDGTFDASEDVIIVDEPLDDQMGARVANNKFAVLEYSYDAQALIAAKEDIASIILTRVGITQQFMNVSRGSAAEGMAASGTALRVRLIPTTLAAKGKGRFWDDDLPVIGMKLQLIDAAPRQQGGFERPWKLAGEPPIVERSEPLPQDESEEVNRHSVAVAAEIESRRTAIQNMHPDWDDDQVQEELEQIQSEMSIFSTPKQLAGAIG